MTVRGIHLLLPLLLLIGGAGSARAQIEVYFNHDVDSSLAWPRGNTARGNADFPTIAAAEIGRARWSVEMAMYSFNSTPVLNALVAAHQRGVRVRVIAHRANVSASSNKFQALVAAGIPVLANPDAPDSQPQPLMHNKFIVVDARPEPPDSLGRLLPVTVTGSWNATLTQSTADYNNLVVVRDSAVSGAYLAEFEEMWGGSGHLPDTTRSRFGPGKSANTDTLFTLADGTLLELRFSPTDRTSRGINTVLASARRSVYTANLVFTYAQFANTLSRVHHNLGVEVRSIIDQRDASSQYDTLQSFADVHLWQGSGMFHHKYAIVDAVPWNLGYPARVITGSHNWSLSAEIRNDENMLVINNDAIANQYLQEFAARYRDAGGTSPFVTTVGVVPDGLPTLRCRALADPFNGSLLLIVEDAAEPVDLRLYSVGGGEVARFTLPAGSNVCRAGALPSGLYLVRLAVGGAVRTLKVLVGR